MQASDSIKQTLQAQKQTRYGIVESVSGDTCTVLIDGTTEAVDAALLGTCSQGDRVAVVGIKNPTVLGNGAGSESTGAVKSVNGKTGVVVLTAGDVGADSEGSAEAVASDLTSHESASDAHQSLFNAKQNTISDLAIIRSGAALGATALQSYTETDPTVPSWAKASTKPSYAYSEITGTPTLATVATSGKYSDLTGTPTIPTVPTNVSAFTNDAGYLTEHQDISGKQDKDTAVTHTKSTAAGSATQPVYVTSAGVATATTYELNKTVPSDAIFTDTVTTATTTGTGNAVTAISASNGALTVTKGHTFATSSDLADKQDTETAVRHSSETAAGSATQPVYVASDGTATATTYELNATVPSDAVFTDTVTTATTSGTGNAVTAITASNGKLTVTKGKTFATTSDLSGKQDTISDLAAIRAGAEAGASAMQESDVSPILTSGTQIATIGSVMLYAPSGGGGGGAVDSVNGQTGTVVLTAGDVGAAATSHTHTMSDISDIKIITGVATVTIAANATSGYVSIGTSLSSFTSNPKITCSIRGAYTRNAGATACVYGATASGRRIYVYHTSSSTSARSYTIDWIAVGN